MNDETTPNQDANGQDESAGTQKTETQKRIDNMAAQKNAALAELAELKASREKEQQETLARNQEWEALAKQYKAELDGKANVESEAKRYRERLEADNQARIERIPESMRSLIPELDDPVKLGKWLTDNDTLLGTPARPIAPNLGGGAGGSVKQADYKLSATELEFARLAGISPEKYAQSKALRGESIDVDKLRKDNK